ncbi:MAG: hypothetical protein GF331_25660 [Chitinivibrionales bacterium]|nr:hypothetical protein [Chitinivibrionales bacterium]
MLLLYLGSCSTHDQHFSAGGYVADGDSRTGIQGATVILEADATGSETLSDAAGYFEVRISVFPDSASAAVLTITKDGYATYSHTYHVIGGSEPDTFFLEPR